MHTSLLADAYVSISLRIRLDKPTDTSSLAYAVISLTQRSHIHNPAQPYSCLDAAVFVNKFFVIIYHPSRFASLVHFNRLIYSYLNSVIDASKTEISITLSITIWGYPSRFSHHTRKRLRIYTIVVFSFVRTFAP